jgi:hypothetical protein
MIQALSLIGGGAASGAVAGTSIGGPVGGLVGGAGGAIVGLADAGLASAIDSESAAQQAQLERRLSKPVDVEAATARSSNAAGAEQQRQLALAKQAAAISGTDALPSMQQEAIADAARNQAEIRAAEITAEQQSQLANRQQVLAEYQAAQGLRNNADAGKGALSSGLGKALGQVALANALNQALAKDMPVDPARQDSAATDDILEKLTAEELKGSDISTLLGRVTESSRPPLQPQDLTATDLRNAGVAPANVGPAPAAVQAPAVVQPSAAAVSGPPAAPSGPSTAAPVSSVAATDATPYMAPGANQAPMPEGDTSQADQQVDGLAFLDGDIKIAPANDFSEKALLGLKTQEDPEFDAFMTRLKETGDYDSVFYEIEKALREME